MAAEDLRLAPPEALRLAQHLIDSGRPFHAHEVLEAVWKTAPESERGLWKGLAQLAVGLTHLRRGNARGAVALLRRGADAVDLFGGTTTLAIDATGICRAARALADRIEQAGLDSVAPADLRLRLTALGALSAKWCGFLWFVGAVMPPTVASLTLRQLRGRPDGTGRRDQEQGQA